MLQITVKEVMVSPVETIEPTESVRAAATKLSTKEIGSLVVCENGTPVGIVTDVDISQLVSDALDPNSTTVERIMSEPLVTIEETKPIEEAAKLLRQHQVKRLPVTDADEDIVGIVTTTDLSNYLPHLVRAGRADQPDESRKRHSVRADTAYEQEDWEYEYLGDESGIDVGDTARFSKVITAEDVETFAEISGDTNRLHLEAEYASRTRFGERIAHGTLVTGIISAALARLPGLIIYLSQDVSFLGPVGLGERVTAECEVVEQIGENRYRLTTEVADPDGDAVIDGEAVVVSDTIPTE